MTKFWEWKNSLIQNQDTGEEALERTLVLDGTIAEDSWFDDDVTPQMFKDELSSGTGDITVWINSPGGDCIAAAQIYNALKSYEGRVKVMIDGLAASAASVIAMAGDEVLISPVGMLMIHNPATIAFGDHTDMQKAIDMLYEVKESIINAYVLKTGLSRSKLSHLMDAETWMNATKAIELGFCDDMIGEAGDEAKKGSMYSNKAMSNVLINKIEAHYKPKETPPEDQAKIEPVNEGRTVNEIMERLLVIKKFI